MDVVQGHSLGRVEVVRGNASAQLGAAELAQLKGWAWLAAVSLAVAGGLALLLALSRSPGAASFLPWAPGDFFRTALVTHVVFSFIIWYLAVLGAFATFATARAGGKASSAGVFGLGLAWAGSALLLGVTLADGGAPSLNNYVPVLDHPLYYGGLGLVAAGILLPVMGLLALGRAAWEQPSSFAVSVASVAYLAALICFALAWAMLPAGLDGATFNERLFWGGGHLLQFTTTALLLAGWHWLSGMATGGPPLAAAPFKAACAALLPFVAAGPLMYGVFDILSLEHRHAFSKLMNHGLVLPPLVIGAGLAVRLVQSRDRLVLKSPAAAALVLSLAVFGIGGVMGYFLGVADTRTPSHYHAVIGGVNLVFMAVLVAIILPLLGRAATGGKAERALFWLYGLGQLLFSLGMFAAGRAGVPRKTAGAEQGLDSIEKMVAMGVTGLGGLIAVAGGVLFVFIMLGRLGRRERKAA